MAQDKISNRRRRSGAGGLVGGGTASDRAFIAELEADSAAAGSSLSGLIPEGRAPRGQGAEYAERRRAAKRIRQMENNLGKLQRTSANYRGQRNGRYAETVRQARAGQLRDGLSSIYKLMEGGGDWAFKAEMANGIADYITAFNGAILRG